jgi:hypothetical protein
MRSCARNCLLLFSLLFFSESLAFAECKCSCKPSPPGGTTECAPGQIAVCSASGDGTCHGSCINIPVRSPIDLGKGIGTEEEPKSVDMIFAATLLSRIFGEKISVSQILENREAFEVIFDRLLESPRSDKAVTVVYNHQVFTVSVALTAVAEDELKSARAQLAGPR